MLEDPYVQRQGIHVPRASRVLGASELPGVPTELWMGGAHSLVGDSWEHDSLRSSWVIDCAGEIDRSFRESSGTWVTCVFPDLDGPLASSNRVADVVQRTVEAIVDGNGATPERVYIMCQHGMNRSGLVTGLILRELGLGGAEAIERIRSARPGALANDYFRGMLLRG